MPTLFDPLDLGAIASPNRILMAPLTRGRATRAAVPTAIMGNYYAQLACAGLIISEATGISRQPRPCRSALRQCSAQPARQGDIL